MSRRDHIGKNWRAFKNLTINDFAHSPYISNRISKSKLSVKKSEEPEPIIEDDNFNDENDNSPQKRTKPKLQSTDNLAENHVYNDYHWDIWFLISEHVLPEDVGNFALICKKTHAITSTAKFWFHLYRKYYSDNVELPVRLQPGCIVRLGGLRSCVIRSLFYTYRPFVQRLKISPDLSTLLKLKCLSVWSKQDKDYWILCFKFKKNTGKIPGKRVRVQERDPEEVDDWESNEDFIAALTDIHANDEDGCRLLIMISERFFPPPNFFGATAVHLKKIIQPLSQDLRTFKLDMTFVDYSGKTIADVSYGPIKHCKVLRWWEPEYYWYLS